MHFPAERCAGPAWKQQKDSAKRHRSPKKLLRPRLSVSSCIQMDGRKAKQVPHQRVAIARRTGKTAPRLAGSGSGRKTQRRPSQARERAQRLLFPAACTSAEFAEVTSCRLRRGAKRGALPRRLIQQLTKKQHSGCCTGRALGVTPLQAVPKSYRNNFRSSDSP